MRVRWPNILGCYWWYLSEYSARLLRVEGSGPIGIYQAMVGLETPGCKNQLHVYGIGCHAPGSGHKMMRGTGSGRRPASPQAAIAAVVALALLLIVVQISQERRNITELVSLWASIWPFLAMRHPQVNCCRVQ